MTEQQGPTAAVDATRIFANDIGTAKIPNEGLVDYVRWNVVLNRWEQHVEPMQARIAQLTAQVAGLQAQLAEATVVPNKILADIHELTQRAVNAMDRNHLKVNYELVERIADWLILEARRTNEHIKAQLVGVLDVAIARGEQLDYDSDDDYRAQYRELTGKQWSKEGDGNE